MHSSALPAATAATAADAATGSLTVFVDAFDIIEQRKKNKQTRKKVKKVGGGDSKPKKQRRAHITLTDEEYRKIKALLEYKEEKPRLDDIQRVLPDQYDWSSMSQEDAMIIKFLCRVHKVNPRKSGHFSQDEQNKCQVIKCSGMVCMGGSCARGHMREGPYGKEDCGNIVPCIEVFGIRVYYDFFKIKDAISDVSSEPDENGFLSEEYKKKFAQVTNEIVNELKKDAAIVIND